MIFDNISQHLILCFPTISTKTSNFGPKSDFKNQNPSGLWNLPCWEFLIMKESDFDVHLKRAVGIQNLKFVDIFNWRKAHRPCICYEFFFAQFTRVTNSSLTFPLLKNWCILQSILSNHKSESLANDIKSLNFFQFERFCQLWDQNFHTKISREIKLTTQASDWWSNCWLEQAQRCAENTKNLKKQTAKIPQKTRFRVFLH